MNNEDLLDGLHVIARRRGLKIQQGDVEFIEAAIKALAKPAPRPEAAPPSSLHVQRADAVEVYMEDGSRWLYKGGEMTRMTDEIARPEAATIETELRDWMEKHGYTRESNVDALIMRFFRQRGPQPGSSVK